VNEDLLHGFQLGELRVEPLQRLVIRPDGSSHLSPRAVEVLLRLASRPGAVRARAELLSEVWGDGGGSQDALNHVISSLRQALHDSSDQPRYIQTVPRRGYRLVVDPVVSAGQAGADTSNPAVSRAGGHAAYVAALKKGGVVETGLAYLVLGWLAIQVADATFEQLMVPPWFGTFITVVIIVGFPTAVVLAWLLEVVRGRAAQGRRRQPRTALSFLRRTVLSIGGGLLVAAGGVYVYDQAVGLPAGETALPTPATALATPTPIEPNSIAVLKFLNIDGSDKTDVFSNGLAEDVISRLASVPSLRVSARGDSFSLPPNASSEAVRTRLRVHFYLEGSVRLTDRVLRVVIHLINSENGFRVFSRSFSRDRAEFFAIQAEITNLTVASLRVVLPPDTQARPGIYGDQPDIDAYVLYRRGMDVLHRPMTASSVEEAVGWFRRSLHLDPEFAAAHAGICTAYAQGYGVTNEAVWIEKAEQSCALAIDYNPNLDVVHSALGDLYAGTGRDREAELAFRRALEINVNSVDALGGLADVYYRAQRLEEAEEMHRRAIGLQPGNWSTYNALGWFLFQNGRYAEAADEFRRIVSIDPTNMQGYSNLGGALMLSGNFAEAAPAFLKAIELEPRRDTYSNLGLMYYYLGQADAAVAAHEKATELAPNDHLAWANLGDALSFASRRNSARAAFRKAEQLAETKLAVNPRDAGTLIDLAWIKAMLGKSGEAQNGIARARELTPGDPYVHFVSALVAVRTGDRTRVYDDLEAAIELGYPLKLVAAEPHLRKLRSEPEFAELTRERMARREPN
jgi:tetratricopeptide (TPR) repeat protein/TolB-like protein/DNA-binding winged helix-turn-helix (wHTH) protein